MIFQIFATMITLVLSSETATTTQTREYCQMPEAVYADGVSAANFGTSGWNYGNTANWKDIVVTCGGSHQSPIDIITSGAQPEQIQLKINYKSKSDKNVYEETNVPYTKEYEGEYAEIEVADASNLVFRYYAKQFHIHTPSEHTIDGKYFDLEIHFVHYAIQDSEQDCNLIKNKITVFGLMFRQSAAAADFEVFKPWFDAKVTGEVDSFDLNDFFSKMADTTYYHYNGSLTTIPCSQTVNWIVFKSPIPISAAQLKQFKVSFADSTKTSKRKSLRNYQQLEVGGKALTFPIKQNNRPIQNLNGRTIFKGTAIIQGEAKIPDISASYASEMLLVLCLVNIVLF